MDVQYFIHRVSDQIETMDVKIPGSDETVTASVAAVEVELVALDDPAHGTVKLSFKGLRAAQAKAKFVQGGTITVPWANLEVTAPATADQGEKPEA